MVNANSHDVTVSNNVMSQNRFGIAATGVDNLNVTGNFFSQRFENAEQRKFWTDNNVLFKNVTGLVWTNNLYKEAYTQVNGGDNSQAFFIEFPISGGVVL